MSEKGTVVDEVCDAGVLAILWQFRLEDPIQAFEAVDGTSIRHGIRSRSSMISIPNSTAWICGLKAPARCATRRPFTCPLIACAASLSILDSIRHDSIRPGTPGPDNGRLVFRLRVRRSLVPCNVLESHTCLVL